MPFLASPLIAAFLLVATADGAKAQLFPWGGWGSSSWQQKPRVKRRNPGHFVEPKVVKDYYPIPETSGGPLLLVVSIRDQKVTVYDGTTVIVTAPISSGMRGHDTPTGIFSILEKNRYHYSNLYGGAPMPFMQRITNSGVALHAGNLPGYPASHGCIRLPYSFARNLFGVTDVGARVIVTDQDVTPIEIASPLLIAPLPQEKSAQKASAEQFPVAEPVSGTKEEFDAVIAGIRPESADDSETRTLQKATADREHRKEMLAKAITDAEEAQTAAVEHAKASADALRDASKMLSEARDEHRKLSRTAGKAKAAAERAQKKFKSLTRKLAKVDVKKIDGEELEKKSDLEVQEENKLLDLVDQAAKAKAATKAQADVVKQASDDVKAAKDARNQANKDVETAKQAVADAKAALKSAQMIEERKDYPVSIFISRKTGRLVAKLGFVEVLDVPVAIKNPDDPIGTHVFTATDYTDGEKSMRWTVATVRPTTGSRPPRSSRRHRTDEEYIEHANGTVEPEEALARIEIPQETRLQLAELMKPRSSLIISDYGLSRETSERTEFILEPWRVRGYR